MFGAVFMFEPIQPQHGHPSDFFCCSFRFFPFLFTTWPPAFPGPFDACAPSPLAMHHVPLNGQNVRQTSLIRAADAFRSRGLIFGIKKSTSQPPRQRIINSKGNHLTRTHFSKRVFSMQNKYHSHHPWGNPRQQGMKNWGSMLYLEPGTGRRFLNSRIAT